MEEIGVINIKIFEENGKNQIAWDTSFTMDEMNLWLDRTKLVLVSGEVTPVEE